MPSVINRIEKGGWTAFIIGMPVTTDAGTDVICAAVYARIQGTTLIEWTTIRPAVFGVANEDEVRITGDFRPEQELLKRTLASIVDSNGGEIRVSDRSIAFNSGPLFKGVEVFEDKDNRCTVIRKAK